MELPHESAGKDWDRTSCKFSRRKVEFKDGAHLREPDPRCVQECTVEHGLVGGQAPSALDAEDQPRKGELKEFQRWVGNKFCRSLDGHKNVFEMNKVMSDASRPTGGPVEGRTNVISCCDHKLTFSWRFMLDELFFEMLLVDAERRSLSSGEAELYVWNFGIRC